MDRVLQSLEDVPPRTSEQAEKTAVRHNRDGRIGFDGRLPEWLPQVLEAIA